MEPCCAAASVLLWGFQGESMLAQLAQEYFVVTISRGRPPVWTWQLQRRSKPLRTIISGADFQTEAAAKLAGEKALIELLHRLAEEDRNVL
jgi:hypothetical protein